MGEPKKPIRVIADLDALEQAAGTTLGASDWIEVTQQRIDTFAEATDDHQWIHVDPQRAESGPFGTTIAHGYFTLSLVPTLLGQILRINGVSATINYGVNRARFPAPVPVGSHLSGTLSLISVDRAAGKATATFSMVIERQGGDKPVSVIEFVFVFLE